MSTVSDFFEGVGEALAETPIGQFHIDTSEKRASLYQQNFFFETDDEPEDIILSPTPLDNQYSFFSPYERGTDFTHDVYSIIYKPISLILLSTLNILQAAGNGLHFVASAYAGLAKLLPILGDDLSFPEISEPSESKYKKGDDVAIWSLFTNTLYPLLQSAYLLSIWLTVDTASSAFSLLSRTVATIFNFTMEFVDDLKDGNDSTYQPTATL